MWNADYGSKMRQKKGAVFLPTAPVQERKIGIVYLRGTQPDLSGYEIRRANPHLLIIISFSSSMWVLLSKSASFWPLLNQHHVRDIDYTFSSRTIKKQGRPPPNGPNREVKSQLS